LIEDQFFAFDILHTVDFWEYAILLGCSLLKLFFLLLQVRFAIQLLLGKQQLFLVFLLFDGHVLNFD
jgi:hypothetical protein